MLTFTVLTCSMCKPNNIFHLEERKVISFFFQIFQNKHSFKKEEKDIFLSLPENKQALTEFQTLLVLQVAANNATSDFNLTSCPCPLTFIMIMKFIMLTVFVLGFKEVDSPLLTSIETSLIY